MQNLNGLQGAAPIWHALMSWAIQDEPVAVWTQPPGLVELAVCNISGLLATPHCPTVSELFIAGTQPTVYDDIYQEFAINRETNRLATIYTPSELVEHRVYKIFPEEASSWVTENNIQGPPNEYDTIRTASGNSSSTLIKWPKPFMSVSGIVEISGIADVDNFAHYRLAYFQGLNPANLQVIEDNVTEPRHNQLLGEWDVSNLDGLVTLLLTVVSEDGSFVEASVPVTVDNTPPTVQLLSPRPNQKLSGVTERFSIWAQANDNVSVTQVKFFLDDAISPFATSKTSPYTVQWRPRGNGCHTISAVATDAAGNETTSSAENVCLDPQE